VDVVVNERERLKKAILDMVSVAPELRLRPHELGKALSHQMEVSRHAVQEAVKDIVQEGHLRFTYHDPTSYLEVLEPAS
jgi:predicted transcriptional regulator